MAVSQKMRLPPFGSWVLLVALAAGVSGASPATASAQSEGAFSASETRHLRRGRLVRRPREERRGNLLLIGGTSFMLIDQPPEVVWRAIRDSRAYQHFLPQVHNVRTIVRGRSGRGRIIRVMHKQGPLEAHYHLRLDFAASVKTVQFRIDSTHDNDVREGWGYIRVQAYGSGRSMVTWAILADVGTGLAVGLVRGEIQRWVLEVPSLLSRYLGWAADRYED